MLDCANDYDNEHTVGQALKELFADGVVVREDLFIQV
jgi:diketogulonate reductase-like aldo/keto reductase